MATSSSIGSLVEAGKLRGPVQIGYTAEKWE